MKSEVIANLAQNYNLSPSDLVYLNYFVDQVDDDDLLSYISSFKFEKKHKLRKPEGFRAQMDKLLLVNAFLRELKRREKKEENKKDPKKMADAQQDKPIDDTQYDRQQKVGKENIGDKNIGEVRSMLLKGESLDSIIQYCSVILSDSLTRKQYKALVKGAEAHIAHELRERHKEIVQSRMRPFKVFTSMQYYHHLAIMTLLVGFTVGVIKYLNYQEDNYLVEYAKIMQMQREFKSVDEDLRNPKLEKRFGFGEKADSSYQDSSSKHPNLENAIGQKAREQLQTKTQRFDFEYECLEQRLAEINDLPITGGDKDAQVIIPTLLEAKIQEYKQFIDEAKQKSKGKPILYPYSLYAKHNLSELLRDTQNIRGKNDEWIQLKLEAFEEATTFPNIVDHLLIGDIGNLWTGLFEKQSTLLFSTNILSTFINYSFLEVMCDSLYAYSLERYGKKEQAEKIAVNWLESIAAFEQPELALMAHRLLAKYYQGEYKLKNTEAKKEKDDDKAKEHLRYIFEQTTHPEEYVDALDDFLRLDVGSSNVETDKFRYYGDSLDTLGLLRAYKDVANFSSGLTKAHTLLKIGKIYLHLKDYEKANAYFDYVQNMLKTDKDDKKETGKKELVEEAKGLVVNPEWERFKETLF